MGKICSEVHGLKGTKVERTTHIDELILRERRCPLCDRIVKSVEQNRVIMEKAAREKRDELALLAAEYKWARVVINELSAAIAKKAEAEEGLIKVAKGERE